MTGPRQSGKTTLCRQVFGHLPYVNLEEPDARAAVQSDARAFLDQFPSGAVIDEVQRVPELLSWIQAAVDSRPGNGQFILTGSQQFELMESVTQSLAGRTALLRLLPLSINELRDAGLPTGTNHLLHAGGYPRIHAHGIEPARMLGAYFETYVERDLRQLVELRHLSEFRRFVQLCAGRTGCLLNLQSLAADVGISSHTARAWVSLLEASYVVYLLPPWFENLGKRLTKAPKLYFYDVGLAAWLVGIRDESQLAAHPLRGHLFENLVVMEFMKHFENGGSRAPLHFYRDSNGVEADLVIEHTLRPGGLGLVEVKAGQTWHPEFTIGLQRVAAALGETRVTRRMLVYGGDQAFRTGSVEVAGIQAGGKLP
ncbi:MAG: ATP-binding protein [Burkholderiales bacterium]|nr:ATP-binding protein [Burkholderiales bacterium]